MARGFAQTLILLAALSVAAAAAGQSGTERRYDWKLLDQVVARQQACASTREKKTASGVTANMRSAQIEYGLCVERLIAQVAAEFYARDAFGPGGIAARIEDVRKPFQQMYWTVYNEAGPCGASGCGTMYQLAHAGKWGDLMDSLLADMIDHVKEQQ